MFRRVIPPFILALALIGASRGTLRADKIQVSPPAVLLTGPESSQQLLVTGTDKTGRSFDLSRRVTYNVVDPKIATVTATGLVQPLDEGRTEIWIQHGEHRVKVPIHAARIRDPIPVSFQQEVIPILSKAGCNSGSCHGKAEGQNGFKLSVFGFDAAADHAALVKEKRGARVVVVAPDRSLLLGKAAGMTPHGGGLKIDRNGTQYRLLRRWIAEGAAFDSVSEDPGSTNETELTARDEIHRAVKIEVEPHERILYANETQQLRVTAIDKDGIRRCVTLQSEFESNASVIAGVDRHGLIASSDIPGEAGILVRYMGHVAVCRVTMPRPSVVFKRPPESNFVDRLVWDKLQRLGIKPSEPAADAVFLRRVFLDTIGTLPTAKEVREFLASESADKRSQLVDQLLQRDEYADYWTMRWADILQVDQAKITPQGAVAMTRWLRKQFRKNTTYDQYVRSIVTARGNTLAEGPASFYQVQNNAELAGRSVSQVFLGVRIECAQCHHHPFEKWSQHDYFAFAGFFTGVGRKAVPTGGQKIFAQAGSDLKHARTGQLAPTAGLGAKPADFDSYTDRRAALVDWMVAADNPFFARAIVNRLWAHYFGRGLVEPIDDMRATNPATNEPLLDALAQHLIDHKFDLKHLTRTFLNSRVYQLSAIPNESNVLDNQNFSRAAWKALPAEVLLDAICQATDIPEDFNGWPRGYRAIQVWDNRMPSYFFRIFGRPQRVSVCECERGNEPSIAQALHLMNSSESMRKIRHRNGRVRQLVDSELKSADIITELYLATVSRVPTEQERALMLQAFSESGSDRRSATEDVMWTLLNTKEFIYNH